MIPHLSLQGTKISRYVDATLAVAIIIIHVFILTILIGCTERNERIEFHFRKDARLKIVNAVNDTLFFDIEIADDHVSRMRGLMFRYSMERDQGMLFIFDFPDIQSFWMQNTFISLDMLFIDDDYRIVHIHENAFPLCEEPIFSTFPVRYVLEILGGVSQKLGIQVGDVVIIMNN